MSIEDNLWFKNGYRVGDILVGKTRHGVECRLIVKYKKTTSHEYIKTKYTTFFSSEDIAWSSTWRRDYLKFKVQDYISDLDSPTDTELSLIQLQFPEIDINMMIEQIKELRE